MAGSIGDIYPQDIEIQNVSRETLISLKLYWQNFHIMLYQPMLLNDGKSLNYCKHRIIKRQAHENYGETFCIAIESVSTTFPRAKS